MKYIQHSNIAGVITAPPSKSIIQRKMLGDFMCRNLTFPNAVLMPDDVITTYDALNMLSQNSSTINLGESGFCLRVIPVISSLFYENNCFLSKGNLFHRPILEQLSSINLKAGFSYDNNNKVLKVEGKLKPGVFHIDGSITSQLLTALLFSLPILDSDSTIYVSHLNSKSYINLTIEILKSYSVEVIHNDFEVFHIKGGQVFNNVENFSEGDWSGSSFLISAAAIASDTGIRISELNMLSVQADIQILDILKKCEINFKLDDNNKSLIIKKSKIKAFEHNFDDCPDLIPAIIPIAINSDDVCICCGVGRLKYKESDRISSLISEFGNCGIRIEYIDDKLLIYPGEFIGTKVDTHRDHRIAMSLSVSALAGSGKLMISDDGCVSKSYPNFWNDMFNLGANCYE